jgi:nitrogen fixation protein FixH
MTSPVGESRAPRRPISGRMVLLCFIGFFGVVAAVNAVMIRAATSTFSGVETGSSYKAGLAFKNELAAARAQDALHWQVSGRLWRQGARQASVEITALDQNGAPLSGLALTARLAHPTDARRDHELPVSGAGAGLFRGVIEAGPGQWDLIVDLWRADERLFRSKSRVILQ